MINKTKLKELIDNYESIINFRNNKINSSTFFKAVEKSLGKSSYCNSCPASIRKAQGDFERITFHQLYKEFPQFIFKPNKEVLSKTRFVNGMYDTLVTSSFESFINLLDSFVKDFKSKRYNMSNEEFATVQEELIAFNTNRHRYFDSDLYKEVIVALNQEDVQEEVLTQDAAGVNSLAERVEEREGREQAIITPKEPEYISEDYLKTEGKYKDRKVNLIEAFELRKSGMSNKDIAAKYGVTKQNITNLFNKHIINYKD